jgi:prevent-host-death family protein
MKQGISKTQFKAKVLEYFRRVQQTGRPIVITDRGKPVLKVVPFTEDPDEALRELRGSVLEYHDPEQPVGEEDWEVLK